MGSWQSLTKRGIDIALGLILSILAAPIGLALAAAVVLDSPGSPLARERRLARGGAPFEMLLLRTRIAGGTNPEDRAITRVGQMLVRTGLDKIPCLLNVLAGQMSLVGPTPVEGLADGTDDLARELGTILAVRPGVITPSQPARKEAALSAAAGDASATRDLEHAAQAIDVDYVRNYSLARDLSLLWAALLGLLAPRSDGRRRLRRYSLAERLRAARSGPVLVDAAIAATMAAVAVGLRIDRTNIIAAAAEYWILVPLAAVVRPAGFVLSGIYLRVWRYPTVSDAAMVVSSLAAGSVVMALVIFAILKPSDFPGTVGFPRSAILIEFVLSLLVLGGVRLAARIRIDPTGAAVPEGAPRAVLICGTGDAAASLVREMHRNPALRLEPVGFVDDDPRNAGRQIYGLRVLGRTEDILRLAAEYELAEVIVAQPKISGERLRAILALCEAASVPVRTLPGVQELLDETVTVNRIRPVRVEDLLRREPAELPDGPMRELVTGRIVLVTGAGGSIGSEACRQVAALGAGRVVLYERAETPLYYIDEELRRRFPGLEVAAVLGDVTDEAAVTRMMERQRPQVVLHAAAQKHVPLSEVNVSQAVWTNVRGTRVMAEAAARLGVETFIFVSTDKAVDPASVMGATKRMGELLIQEIGATAKGRFVIVRFGNVLGSQGSVLELFRQQIQDGGPVTVTHPEMTRYFMTIPEAVRLILHAGAVGETGAIHVLNMGQPIRIVDLARDVIRLSAPAGDKDIQILFSGLRAGEKLEESLFADDEEAIPTGSQLLVLARPRSPAAVARSGHLERARHVEELAACGNDEDVRAILLERPLPVPPADGQS